MTLNTSTGVQGSGPGMRGEIQKQWSKFTYQDVAALKRTGPVQVSAGQGTGAERRRRVREGSAALIRLRWIHQRRQQCYRVTARTSLIDFRGCTKCRELWVLALPFCAKRRIYFDIASTKKWRTP